MSDLAPVRPESLKLLYHASTATVSTQLFKRGLRNTFLVGLRPLNLSSARFVGEAFTLRYIPAREDLDVLGAFDDPEHPQRKAIETIPPGQVLVIDCRGETRAASAGHILATRLWKRGAVALVTDGALRDSPSIARMDFPAFCAAASAALNLAVHHAVEFQTPIACAGVAVFPGDVLVGDEEGVVVLPRHLVDEIAAPAAEQERLEEFIQQRVVEGHPLMGTYPPRQETLEAYETWRKASDKHG